MLTATLALLFTSYAKKGAIMSSSNLTESDWLKEVDVESVRPYLLSFAEAVASVFAERDERRTCKTIMIGQGWGGHKLCNTIPQKCTFYSFGISSDYSFDLSLADNYSCNGFAADPTVTHPSKLHPLVTFHQIGAKLLRKNNNEWLSTSMPSLMKWKQDKWVDVLKMDCEGCEYSLARDVFVEDPSFFHKIGQLAIEIHVSRVWLNTTEHLYALGKLLKQLQDAGLYLADAVVGGCAPSDEAAGCMDVLHEVGIPCGKGKSCHNYLFSRSQTAK